MRRPILVAKGWHRTPSPETREPMKCYTIYDHPLDYPDHFVVRTWLIKAGVIEPEPTDEVKLAATLEEARQHIPQQCIRFQRNEGDDLNIVETWL